MDKKIADTTDRISQLPECLVHHIMSFLDSPLELVRMSVLSKKWFALTAFFPNLDFDIRKFTAAIHASGVPSKIYNDSGYVMDKFLKYVNYTTSRFCEQNVNAHKLILVTVLRGHMDVNIINRCLELVLKQGVQMFEVNIMSSAKHLPMYHLPKALLSVSSLVSLKIRCCGLPSSMMVNDVKFKSLKRLHLQKVPIDEKTIKYLTTSCPLLKEFNVKDCYGFKRFCVYGHQTLQKVQIYYNRTVERIDIEAPNLRYLLLMDWEGRGTPSMNLASCKQLTTLSYYEYPSPKSNGLSNFSSNFPFIENLFLKFPNKCNLKLSSPSLRTFVLHSQCDLEEIDIDTPNLHLFEYKGHSHMPAPLVKDSTQSKALMECHPSDDVDTLWFQKLRRFLDNKNVFKVLKLHISANFINTEDLKVIQSPPYELEHLELELETTQESSVYVAVVDAVLWCCRPRSLTLRLNSPFSGFKERNRVVKLIYMKLLQQEDQGQTNVQILFSSTSSKVKRHFSNLNLFLKALPRNRLGVGQSITFIKEEDNTLLTAKQLSKKQDIATIKSMRMWRLRDCGTTKGGESK